jgi:hypothetical protein
VEPVVTHLIQNLQQHDEILAPPLTLVGALYPLSQLIDNKQPSAAQPAKQLSVKRMQYEQNEAGEKIRTTSRKKKKPTIAALLDKSANNDNENNG